MRRSKSAVRAPGETVGRRRAPATGTVLFLDGDGFEDVDDCLGDEVGDDHPAHPLLLDAATRQAAEWTGLSRSGRSRKRLAVARARGVVSVPGVPSSPRCRAVTRRVRTPPQDASGSTTRRSMAVFPRASR
jgi:hypothetical protein